MTLDTVTLEDALQLLTLPRVVGTDPESGDEITAQNGRYGPYLKKGTDSRSIDARGEAPHDHARGGAGDLRPAQAARPCGRRPRAGSSATTRPPAAKVTVKSGRFGPYVTDGEYNATLRKGDDEATITLERAAELLAEKRAKGPAPKKRGAKKTAAKKTAAKKTREEGRRPRRARPRRLQPRSRSRG